MGLVPRVLAARCRSGSSPGRAELAPRGKTFHDETAGFEERSRSAISLGWWLLVLAVLVALLALVLMGGSDA